MRILISGASGLIGTALMAELKKQGHQIARLVRRPADWAKKEVYWDSEKGSLDKSPLVEFQPEAVIHLAGENIAAGRWNKKLKAKIRDSRVNGTRVLSQVLASLEPKPKVLVMASAMGYYGDRGNELLIENADPGDNFLAKVCTEWEAAAQPAEEAGIRVVKLRTGVVLSKKGGALKKMLLPFRLGLGGVMGNGRQYMSWITLTDVVRAYLFALEQDSLSGPVNAVSPNPVTNKEFTKTLGKVLFRPTLFSMPASTVRMVFGEMAEELLLASARVKPGALEKAGFKFAHPELKEALKSVLGKSSQKISFEDVDSSSLAG